SAGLIGEITNPPVEVASCWGPGPRPRIARPTIGKQAIPLLLQALKDPAAEVRANAAASLGLIGSDAKAAVPPLIGALEDKDASARTAAAAALGNLGETARAAVPALVRALRDPDRRVGLGAVSSLRQLDADAFLKFALPFLIATIRDKEGKDRLRESAVYALENLGPRGKAAVPALCELLKDKDRYV